MYIVSLGNVEIRNNVSAEVKEDKVHHKQKSKVDNNKGPFVKSDEKREKSNKKKKKYITIEGTKKNNDKIQVEAFLKGESESSHTVGRLLDTKK